MSNIIKPENNQNIIGENFIVNKLTMNSSGVVSENFKIGAFYRESETDNELLKASDFVDVVIEIVQDSSINFTRKVPESFSGVDITYYDFLETTLDNTDNFYDIWLALIVTDEFSGKDIPVLLKKLNKEYHFDILGGSGIPEILKVENVSFNVSLQNETENFNIIRS